MEHALDAACSPDGREAGTGGSPLSAAGGFRRLPRERGDGTWPQRVRETRSTTTPRRNEVT